MRIYPPDGRERYLDFDQERMATERSRNESECPRGRRQNAQGKRASVACALCRGRRTKCVMPDGQTSCEYCQKNLLDCVVTEDERRRPTSKAYIDSLRSRITLLEDLLRQKGLSGLPGDSFENSEMDSNDIQSYQPRTSPRQNYHDIPEAIYMGPGAQPNVLLSEPIDVETIQEFPSHFDATQVLLPDISTTVSSRSEARVSVAIEDIAPSTVTMIAISGEDDDYLLSLYWTHYNSILPLIDRTSFEEDKKNGGGKFFSNVLERCLLAMGFAFADRARLETNQLRSSWDANPLHTEITRIFEQGSDKAPDLPSLQAMLLLGELELRAGRPRRGWNFVAMAFKAYFHLKVDEDIISTKYFELVEQSKHAVRLAIAVYGQFWTMLGRPTEIGASDSPSCQRDVAFDALINKCSLSLQNDLEAQVKGSSLELLVILIGVNGFSREKASSADQSTYLDLSEFDSQLDRWYAKLPLDLKWNKENLSSAPPSYFLMHQQYHASLISLHSNFAYCTITDHESGPISQLQELSRAVCKENAIRISIIVEEYRQRHDTRMIFVTGLQHITSASATLVSEILLTDDPQNQGNSLHHLKNLAVVLGSMRTSYKPATRMFEALKTSIRDLEQFAFPNSYQGPRQSTEFPSDADNSESAEMMFLLDPLRGRPASQQYSMTPWTLNVNSSSDPEDIVIPEKRREGASAVVCTNSAPDMCEELDDLLKNWEGQASLLDGALLLGLGGRQDFDDHIF